MTSRTVTTTMSRPSRGNESAPYTFNRAPLQANAMAKLPLGAIKPGGWLKHQLDLMTQGLTGRLPEISEFLKADNGWFGTDKEGWEEQPYWLRGYYSLAHVSGDPRMQYESRRWLDAVLESQQPDGYFGPAFHKEFKIPDGRVVCDLWGHMVMLDAVIRHHEVTQDKRVIPFMTRFFAFCRDLPDAQFIPPLAWDAGKPSVQHNRAGDMLPHIYWLYNRTGEAWLIPLARRFYHAVRKPEGEWLVAHGIDFIQRFAVPALYFTQSGRQRDLDLTRYWYTQHMGTWGQQPRGIFGADEAIRPGCVDPRQGFETCGFGEFARTFYELGRLTGDPAYADKVEDLLYNHFPASFTPDMKALHYLTCSNLPQLDASNHHEFCNKDRQVDYTSWIHRCCRHNSAMTWPWLVENLWQASSDGGLVAWIYADCRVNATVKGGRCVTLTESTRYPFNGGVDLAVELEAPTTFPLYFRVPAWCMDVGIQVNGQAVEANARPGHYVRIEREWANGDIIRIHMGMTVTLTTWPRTGSVTVDRGPLSYSVRISESWKRHGGTDEWPDWEVFPTTPWNYGLVLDEHDPLHDFAVEEKSEVPEQPWTVDAAPVEITARAKRIPGWTQENDTVAELRESPIRSDEPDETITLIPLGCARLRMSCLPVVSNDPDARPWS